MVPKDFGALNSVLSLFSVETALVTVVSMVVARYVSQFQALQEMGKLRLFLINSFKNLALLGVFIAFLVWITRFWVADYLRLESTMPIMVLTGVVFFAFIYPLGTSYLQGLQLFTRLGFVLLTGGLFRLGFGILLVLFGFGVSGALTANFFAFIPILFFFYRPLMNIVKIKYSGPVEKHTREILAFSIPVGLAFLGNIGMMNLDLILVKHFFSPESVGQYAAATVLGRSVLYLPGALVMTMYPMVAEAQALQTDAHTYLKRCIILTSVLAGCGVILFFIMPDFLIRILFGSQYPEAGQLLSFYSLAMFFLTLSNVLIQYNLAIKDFRFIYVLLGVLAFEGMAIQYFHDSFKIILLILNLSQGALLVILGSFKVAKKP